MKPVLKLFFVLFFLVIVGCADHIISECSIENNKAGVIQKATFAELQNQVFTPSCATTGCHKGSSAPFGLELTSDKSYLNLVNIQSQQNPAFVRVSPGSSSNSYIIKKLRGQGTSFMPPPGKLNSSLIDSVAAWIDRGALND